MLTKSHWNLLLFTVVATHCSPLQTSLLEWVWPNSLGPVRLKMIIIHPWLWVTGSGIGTLFFYWRSQTSSFLLDMNKEGYSQAAAETFFTNRIKLPLQMKVRASLNAGDTFWKIRYSEILFLGEYLRVYWQKFPQDCSLPTQIMWHLWHLVCCSQDQATPNNARSNQAQENTMQSEDLVTIGYMRLLPE